MSGAKLIRPPVRRKTYVRVKDIETFQGFLRRLQHEPVRELSQMLL
jgi:hypothetical protein